MYKLFLTFRYLTRKAIVVFPILVVWLCVMMLIIVTSIMGGFVGRVLDANRDLVGDVVIDAPSLAGWPYYQQLQAEIEKMPEVAAVTPAVKAYGLINLPEYHVNNVAQIVGVDPAGRARVSGWGRTLFRQYLSPLEAADDLKSALPAKGADLLTHARDLSLAAAKHADDLSAAELPPKLTTLELSLRAALGIIGLIAIGLLISALWRLRVLLRWLSVIASIAVLLGLGALAWNTWARRNLDKQRDFLEDAREQARETADRLERTADFAESLSAEKSFATRADLVAALVPSSPTFTPPSDALYHYGARSNLPSDGGCIVGIDVLPLATRDRRGNYEHDNGLAFTKAVLTVMPVKASGLALEPKYGSFVIVDDSHTGMYEVDTTFVYAPFEKVQFMANMQPVTNADGSLALNPDGTPIRPGRCSELQIKLKDASNPDLLRDVTQRINQKIADFAEAHEELRGIRLIAQTSEQRQARYIEAVRNEKRLITFILGLMSLVVVVVIFLIFYMIVRDKTRDIGIIKALGGSEEGVAAIFMMYGLFIGFVGGLLGMITGVLFVWHTNEIHEWIFRTTGIMIWNRSVYMFDRIPDTVYWPEVLGYVAAAILAGLIGALVPAIVAGAQDPVRAVRYE